MGRGVGGGYRCEYGSDAGPRKRKGRDVRGFGMGRSRIKGCSVAGEGSVGLVLCESRHVVRRAKRWV